MKIILFIIGVILGITLSFSSKFLPEKKLMEEEEVETINCNDVFILDSVEFANVADSVVHYGDNIAYMILFDHFASINNGLNDYMFYSFFMANKYSCPQASYENYSIIKNVVNAKKSVLLKRMLKYYLLYGAKLGDSESCSTLEECYKNGEYFEKDIHKARFYKKKREKMEEIKWSN